MTNKERQTQLDKKKYLSSQIHLEDLSGEMIYCYSCKHRTCLNTCETTQKHREELCLCAIAYNKMKRKK